MGSVGDDDNASLLAKANERQGVSNALHVEVGHETGSCAVIVTGSDRFVRARQRVWINSKGRNSPILRSLVTNLAAAKLFKETHLDQPHIETLIKSSAYLYISGYYLTSGIDSALRLAKLAEDSGRKIVLNLAAPYLPQKYLHELERLLPFVDIVIGNDAEFAAWNSARKPVEVSLHSNFTAHGPHTDASMICLRAPLVAIPLCLPHRLCLRRAEAICKLP